MSSCPVVSYFFFSSRRRHTRSKRDWSSDVCSSDLGRVIGAQRRAEHLHQGSLRERLRGGTGAGGMVGAALGALAGGSLSEPAAVTTSSAHGGIPSGGGRWGEPRKKTAADRALPRGPCV